MHNYPNNSIQRVVSFNSTRAHNCPHCHCNSEKQAIERPTSPTYNKIIIPKHTPPPCNLHKPQIITQLSPPKLQIRASNSPLNIYYQRSDMIDARKYATMNRSISSRCSSTQNQARVQNSPLNNIKRINIRYLSPQMNLNSKKSQQLPVIQPHNSLYKTGYFKSILPSVYFDRNLSPNQNIKSNNNRMQQKSQNFEIGMQQNIPRVPSILKRKSSQNKKLQLKNPTLQKCETQVYKNKFEDVQAMLSRKAIKSSSMPTSNCEVIVKQHQPSACDILLDQQEDRLIALQISKDLKLNYDYFQTSDVSKLSSNIYS